MRILVKMQIPNEAGNRMVQDPNFLKNIEDYIKNFNIEAAYFTEINGERTAFYVLDLPTTDQLAKAVEPLFQGFNAKVEVHPAMNFEELKKVYQKT
jgi:hypothetical protein